MFESVVSKFVKAVGRDLYLPSPSIASSENLVPLAIVERKGSRWIWGSNKYYTTEFKLTDVLKKSPAPVQVKLEPEKDLAGVEKTCVVNIKGKLEGHFKSLFEAELDNVDSITIKADLGDLHMIEVDQQSLLDTTKGLALDMKHELIREISQKDRRALCLVVAVVKTTKEVKMTATLNLAFDADAKVNVPVTAAVAGGEASENVDENKSRTITLPVGTVLAYQVVELAVNTQGNFRVMVSNHCAGGFNRTDVDAVDGEKDQLQTMRLSSAFQDLHSLPKEKRKSVTQALLKLCEDKQLLKALSKDLYEGKLSPDSKDEDLKAAVNMILSEKEMQKAIPDIQSLCASLASLDHEALNTISGMDFRQISLLSLILNKAVNDATLSRSDPYVVELFLHKDTCLHFLLGDLMFNLTDDGLFSSLKNNVLIRMAYKSLYGLSVGN